jgi:hypothetical protein
LIEVKPDKPYYPYGPPPPPVTWRDIFLTFVVLFLLAVGVVAGQKYWDDIQPVAARFE